MAIRKLLPLLASALEFGGAPPQAVGSLLLIGNQLESDEFNKRVVPTLSKLFASPGAEAGAVQGLLRGLAVAAGWGRAGGRWWRCVEHAGRDDGCREHQTCHQLATHHHKS